MRNNTIVHRKTVLRLLMISVLSSLTVSCGVSVNYSMTGAGTEAETISIAEFYNNADLGPANMAQTLTNDLKNYFVQNSNLSVVTEEGELQLEGEIMDFRLTPIAPTSTGNPDDINRASSTRLTITVRATYINTLKEDMSLRIKAFPSTRTSTTNLMWPTWRMLLSKRFSSASLMISLTRQWPTGER